MAVCTIKYNIIYFISDKMVCQMIFFFSLPDYSHMVQQSILAFLFVFGKDKDFVENVGMVVQTVQIIVMLATIFPTEAALRKNFDKNGIRKELKT